MLSFLSPIPLLIHSATRQQLPIYSTQFVPSLIFPLLFSSTSPLSTNHRSCWNCESPSPDCSLFCQKCKCIQGPPSTSAKPCSFFCLFDIEEKFDVDLKDLKSKYFKLQLQLHPDKFHQKTTIERKLSDAQNSRLIEAFKCLNDPVDRARYLLKRNYPQFEENYQLTNFDILQRVFDYQQSFEDCDTQNLLDLKSLLGKVSTDYSMSETEFKNLFQSQEFEKAQDSLAEMSYLHKLLKEISTTVNDTQNGQI